MLGGETSWSETSVSETSWSKKRHVAKKNNLYTTRRPNLPEIREKGYLGAPECWQKIYFICFFFFCFFFFKQHVLKCTA